MSLNIKNEEAVRLVNEVARITGESKTDAVIESLRQRLNRVQRYNDRTSLKLDMLKIGEKCAAYSGSHLDHDELLYDKDGFPDGC